MATAAVEIPPSNHVLPGSHLISTPDWPEPTKSSTEDTDPYNVASSWVSAFNESIKSDRASLQSLFAEESYWRDLLCLSWDFHTLQGPSKIGNFAKNIVDASTLQVDDSRDHKKPQLVDLAGVKVVQTFLKIETKVGRGEGLVRLVKDAKGDDWKALTLFTMLKELKGHEETTQTRRPLGTERDPAAGGVNWKDHRDAEMNFEGDREPVVLILGAGQGGLTVAARLKQLGVKALVIDRNPRIGDNWRNRYHQLVLHDSVWYDHMPYLPFPSSWPVFTPKDKLADWFAIYADALELNVWTSTNLESSSWDDEGRQWTVTLDRQQEGKTGQRTLHPRHIILATGHSGEPYMPTNISGIEGFKGDRLVHSSGYTKPAKNAQGKKAVVVGCCNSGHDIARDYYDHGYHVTIIQRSSTLVVTSDTVMDGMMKGVYEENGPPVEDADIINMSWPTPIAKRLQIGATKQMMDRDGPLLRGLMDAGFAVDSGPDRSGLWIKYLARGGGYYIDVGTSQLIADRKIKVKQGHGVKAVKPHSIVLQDDTELEADEIIFATGYRNMRETAQKVFGDELADRVNDVWGFDEEGETRGMWRRSGHPGFWFFGGNLALCRFYSRLCALQIKAIEVGLAKA